MHIDSVCLSKYQTSFLNNLRLIGKWQDNPDTSYNLKSMFTAANSHGNTHHSQNIGVNVD